MEIKPLTPTPTDGNDGPPPGLDGLQNVELTEDHRIVVERASKIALGSAPWRARKVFELKQLLRLEQIAPADRFGVIGIDNTEALRVVMRLGVTAATMPPGSEQLVVRTDGVVVEMRYPQDVMFSEVPGTQVACVRQPRWVWHPNIAHKEGVLCLGKKLPRNIPAFQIVLRCYEALAMTNLMLDVTDPAGVMNGQRGPVVGLPAHGPPAVNLNPFSR